MLMSAIIVVARLMTISVATVSLDIAMIAASKSIIVHAKFVRNVPSRVVAQKKFVRSVSPVANALVSIFVQTAAVVLSVLGQPCWPAGLVRTVANIHANARPAMSCARRDVAVRMNFAQAVGTALSVLIQAQRFDVLPDIVAIAVPTLTIASEWLVKRAPKRVIAQIKSVWIVNVVANVWR